MFEVLVIEEYSGTVRTVAAYATHGEALLACLALRVVLPRMCYSLHIVDGAS